jgi:methylated-DNA-[protein]-cysteine S-methyltransferase
MKKDRLSEVNGHLTYAWLDTDITGRIYVAASESGVTDIVMGTDEVAFIRHLLQRHPDSTITEDFEKTAPLRNLLTAYFAGEKIDPTTCPVDLRGVTDFQWHTYRVTRAIVRGSTFTYGEIGFAMGRLNVARAVGQAMARNPIPLVIPCHRVIGSGGRLGGYSAPGGVEVKRALLEIEGVEV